MKKTRAFFYNQAKKEAQKLGAKLQYKWPYGSTHMWSNYNEQLKFTSNKKSVDVIEQTNKDIDKKYLKLAPYIPFRSTQDEGKKNREINKKYLQAVKEYVRTKGDKTYHNPYVTNIKKLISESTPLKAIQASKLISKINAKALKGHIKCLVIEPHEYRNSYELFLDVATPVMVNSLKDELKHMKALKYRNNMLCEFYREVDGEMVIEPFYIWQEEQDTIFPTTDITTSIITANSDMIKSIEEIEKKGSGYIFLRVIYLYINIAKYEPIRGGSYIPLPKWIQDKHAVLNIQNEDDLCFKYCIIAGKHPIDSKNHPNNVKHYNKPEYFKEIKDEGFSYPFVCSVPNFQKFEKLNNISLNVYGFDGKSPEIIHQTTNLQKEHYNLLYIGEQYHPDMEKLKIKFEGKNHYCLIKNMSRLFPNKNYDGAHYICNSCLWPFTSEKRYNNHIKLGCEALGPCPVKMPEPNKAYMKFKHEQNQELIPIYCTADFECILKPVEDNKSESKTIKQHEHIACGACIRIVSNLEQVKSETWLYRGEDVVEKFVNKIHEISETMKQVYKTNEKMKITAKQIEEHEKATQCYMCKKKFTKENYKTRAHNHNTGEYIGPACNACNKKRKNEKFVPVIFHNLKNYDSHLFICELAKQFKKIDITPNNMEKYMMIKVDNIRFIDSFQFMSTSLEVLVENLYKSNDLNKFKNMKNHFNKLNDEQLKMLIRKGVYPYEWFDSFDKFNQPCDWKIKDFFSSLRNETISEEDYKHYKKVCEMFNIKNCGEYHDLYLYTDVLLLADIWENFRQISHINYGIDPSYYITAPSMAWDACLKMTGVTLELLTDPDKHIFYEKGIRGGMSTIFKRYSKANNKYMPTYDEMDKSFLSFVGVYDMPTYDKNDKSKYIMYNDANNLYAWAMIQALPTGGFEWVDIHTEEYKKQQYLKNKKGLLDYYLLDANVKTMPSKQEIKELAKKKTNDETIDIDNIDALFKNPKIGYTLMVDLEYPKELHDLHNDYPLCPEKMTITKDMLSPYCKKLKEQLNNKYVPTELLISNLYDKKDYVIDYRILKLYLDLGMKLTKIHKVLKYKQEPWLKPYIDFNTSQRIKASKAKNNFEKDFYKLMNNSVFGKTMENVRKRQNITLCTTDEEEKRHKLTKLVSKPTYKGYKIFNEDLVAVHMKQSHVTLDKPIYVGFTILELSKYHMYNFHYNVMKKRYGDKINLLFTDTDSLCYEIETDDVYDDFKQMGEHFDFSEYPKEHKCFDITNDKVIGKFKDESCSKIMTEFVGIRSKMYSYLIQNDHNTHTKAKGVNKTAQKYIKHENYKHAIFGTSNNDIQQNVTMMNIRSVDHHIYTIKQNKISLDSSDTKRYLVDNINTLAYGHYKNNQK